MEIVWSQKMLNINYRKHIRDEMMFTLDKLYPHYGFIKHKGYKTKMHLDTLGRMDWFRCASSYIQAMCPYVQNRYLTATFSLFVSGYKSIRYAKFCKDNPIPQQLLTWITCKVG